MEAASRKIVIAGGSGFIGRRLAGQLAQDYPVIILSRTIPADTALADNIRICRYDSSWPDLIQSNDVVINLAGKSVACRWTTEALHEIIQSRVETSRNLIERMMAAKNPPRLYLQASATGFYGPGPVVARDENYPAGRGILADICRQWEEPCQELQRAGIPAAILRLGVVLGREGGMLGKILQAGWPLVLFKPACAGQMLSWIHVTDIGGIVDFLINRNDAGGVYNLCAPHPVTADEFYRAIAGRCRIPVAVAIPGFVIRLMLGKMADEMLFASQEIYPGRLQQMGYRFKYGAINEALDNLLGIQKGDKP